MDDKEPDNPQEKKDSEGSNSEGSEWNTWIVATGSELREAFGLTAENRPIIKLNPEFVPDELRELIPYAEEWGIDDDLIRGDVIDKASPEALKDFVFTVSGYLDLIDKWLAGPEADLDEHTEEYNVFSAMMMAYDETRYSL